MKRFAILLFPIFLCQISMAQQYPLFTNFMMNRYGFNPAIHTDTIGICADLVYRKQWTGLEGAPETMIAGLRGRVRPLPIGVGGYFFTDRAGVLKRTGGYAMFNFVKTLGPETNLSVGAAVGMYTLGLEDNYRAQDEADQLIPNALAGKRYFDFNAGIYLEHQNLYAGFSVPQIEQRKLTFSGEPELSVLQRHYYLLAGYKYQLKEKIWLEPMGLLKHTQYAPLQWDAGLKVTLDKFWLGGTYRKTDALTAMIGLNLGRLQIGYAYDVTTSNLNTTSNGSHELTLHACFGKPKDSDGDGIPDELDTCPDVPGKKEFEGCPEDSYNEMMAALEDDDLDGVPNGQDKCPNLAGSPAEQGCPFGDRDGDGIRNDIDGCPDLAGVSSNRGCPVDDRDQDGIVDKFDRCPDVAGAIRTGGCPDNDTDGDGILDSDDDCPNTAGLQSKGGCPEVTKAEEVTLDLAIRNLYFDTNKWDIWQSSERYLDRLAEVMIEHPDWQLSLVGHTDARASEEYNLELSKRRAESVKSYLVARGVQPRQLLTDYYGEAKPAATNTSESGMQLNRRVEMTFVFQ